MVFIHILNEFFIFYVFILVILLQLYLSFLLVFFNYAYIAFLQVIFAILYAGQTIAYGIVVKE